MSVLQKEVEEALKGFKPSQAIYRISLDYRNKLSVIKIYRPTSDGTDFVTKMVQNSHVNEHYDWLNNKHVLSDWNSSEICNSIRWEMQNYFSSFANKYYDSKNNKLTALYRWFNGVIGQYVLQQHPDLEKDLWHIFKWLKSTDSHSKLSEHTQNAIKLLEVVRQRYEAKGIRI